MSTYITKCDCGKDGKEIFIFGKGKVTICDECLNTLRDLNALTNGGN